MLAIYKKEMRSYFRSIIGWLFIAFFLAFTGLYFFIYNLGYGYPYFEYALSSVTIILVLLIPMITMRIMSEENKQKTDQLLLTAPVSTTKIILGKFLAAASLLGIVNLIFCFYPLILGKYGSVNYKMTYSLILCFFLMGCTYLAIGVYISCLTENQIIAAVATFAIVLISYLADGIASLFATTAITAWIVFAVIFVIFTVIIYISTSTPSIPLVFFLVTEGILAYIYFFKSSLLEGSITTVFSWISVASRFDNMITGSLQVASFVYYLSLIGLFVFLSIQSLNKRRWN